MRKGDKVCRRDGLGVQAAAEHQDTALSAMQAIMSTHVVISMNAAIMRRANRVCDDDLAADAAHGYLGLQVAP
jgi:hypothetical protein